MISVEESKSHVDTEEYKNTFTPESIERAKRYAKLFQHSCHFMNDEEILEVLNIVKKKVRNTFERTGEQMYEMLDDMMGVY